MKHCDRCQHKTQINKTDASTLSSVRLACLDVLVVAEVDIAVDHDVKDIVGWSTSGDAVV